MLGHQDGAEAPARPPLPDIEQVRAQSLAGAERRIGEAPGRANRRPGSI